jgi:hypothetical protein
MNQQPDTSTTQGKIAVMTAAEEGKRIQWSTRRTHWIDCVSHDTPSWSWNELTYRIHPDDLNPPDPHQHLKDALKAGKRIGIKSTNRYYDKNYPWKFCYRPDLYEIEPDPQPWTMADVPPVCWLRLNEGADCNSIQTITSWGLCLNDTSHVRWAELARDYLWSSDLKTWHPCVKGAA